VRGELHAPHDDDDDALADARAIGIDLSPEDLSPERATGVWAENVAAVTAFLAVSTQWRVAAGATGLVITGLDYAGVRAGIEAIGIEITPRLWGDVQMIEAGALAELNRQRR
jgi:hypothetical protein